MTVLTVTTAHDYRPDTLSGIDAITFATAGGASAEFNSSQFNGTAISTSPAITGDTMGDAISVFLSPSGTFSAAGWTFTTWAGNTVNIFGSSGADTITGSSDATYITGGAGRDTLRGGSGGSIFVYHQTSDLRAGESIDGQGGADSIQISIDAAGLFNFSHATIASVENLQFASDLLATVKLGGSEIGTGHIAGVSADGAGAASLVVRGSTVDLSGVTFVSWTAGVDSIAIKGTGHANHLIGSDQSDVINGAGGGDVMQGFGGDDLYFVNRRSDVVDESLGGSDGNDTVQSSVSFKLGGSHALGDVENLVLTGSGNTKGTGNGLANSIVGNGGNNLLKGGDNGDSLKGGGGRDILVAGAGDDTLQGEAGRDVLAGEDGTDTLTGGGGRDAFRFDFALNDVTNVDQITDFTHLQDALNLKHGVFSAIARGHLSAGEFVLGTDAADADDRIIYDQASGKLFYDDDGNGGDAKVLFAILANLGPLGHADIIVV